MGAKNDLKQWALYYASKGLAVFPLAPRDKKPAIQTGFKSATTSMDQVKEWWAQNPNYNIGIATGQASGGLVVIDLDVDEEKGKNGYETLKEWQREHEELPDSWTSITGRGGYHFFYKSTEPEKSRVELYDAVDIRADGGYIVAPPSLHPNGRRYEWEYSPDFPLTEVNDTVKAFLHPKQEKQETFKMSETIPEGQRVESLVKLSGSLQAKGIGEAAIIAALKAENESKCNPPLTDQEMEREVFPSLKRGWKTEQPYAADPEIKKLFKLTKQGTPKQGIENCVIAAKHDPLLSGRLFYNELTGKVEMIGPFPWRRYSLELSDNDVTQIRFHFESLYDLNSEKGVPRAIEIVAHQNAYHPIKKKLESLKWDGKPRIRHALKHFLGVHETEFSYEALKVFMMGALERLYKPGCKFEYIFCIIGDQGVGKSTFIRFLALNDQWFYDGIKNLGDKATLEEIQGIWICEFSEMLATANAKSIEEIKAFISRQKDIYRSAYAHFAETRYRQCVFCGTTNNQDFLPMDRTGNRRFIPLLADRDNMEVHILDNEKESRAYMEQMWAEAMEIYQSGEYSLTLSKEMTEVLEEIQEEFKPEDTKAGIVQDWLDRTTEPYVCTRMIWKEALCRLDEPKRWELQEIADIMNHSIRGWVKCQKTGNRHLFAGTYGRQRAWERDGKNEFVPVDKGAAVIFDD